MAACGPGPGGELMSMISSYLCGYQMKGLSNKVVFTSSSEIKIYMNLPHVYLSKSHQDVYFTLIRLIISPGPIYIPIRIHTDCPEDL